MLLKQPPSFAPRANELSHVYKRLDPDASASAGAVWTSGQWRDYFRRNGGQLLEIPWDRDAEITDAQRTAIASSVQEFQLGESGEGSHFLSCAARHAAASGDRDYPEAAGLFLAEEHRHARDLGRFLDLAGVPRIKKAWPDAAFRFLRHRAGLELSIAVLVSAEIIAQVYYLGLWRATDSRVLRRLCHQILSDELHHVRFQCERLALLRREMPGWMFRLAVAAHRAFFAAACLVFWRQHRRAMRAGGYDLASFWRDAHAKLELAVVLMTPGG